MTVARLLMDWGRSSRPEPGTARTPTASAAHKYAHGINAEALASQSGSTDPVRAISALHAIPTPGAEDELARKKWLHIAFAANAAGTPVDDFLQWARRGAKYTTDAKELKAWNSFDPTRSNGIGAGTLFHIARQHGWADPTRAVVPLQAANDATADEQAQPTDLWLARYYSRECNANYRFDHSIKQWRNYRAGSWTPCRKGEHIEAMKGLAGTLMQRLGKLMTFNPQNLDLGKLRGLVQRAQSASGIEAALKLAQSEPELATSADEFDTDPDLFNTANGVVHLSTHTHTQHDAGQMLFRQSPVAYDTNATCPMFAQFLDEVSCNDPAWVEFMQRALGYALSGHVSEEKLFFWLGKGANGKSVLANLVRYILGTYAATVPPAFMMQSRRDGGGATPELAMLAGVRAALANEIEAGSKLSAQTVKVAVSTEHITARHLYGAPFTFAPTHKLLIRGNHRPMVTDGDEGIWRRILLIPFDLDVPAHLRDPDLEARLLTEAPGILRWMVEGFVKWRQGGLIIPKRVTDATLAYRNESDLLAQWIAEHCEIGPTFSVHQKTAYGRYRMWCHEQGLRQFSKVSFTRGLTERGFGEGREGGGTRQHLYTGLRIRP